MTLGLAALAAVGALAGDPGAGRELIWADEFDGDRLDPARWTASEDCWGGGNQERQCYTASPANISVSDGLLRLTARSETATGPRWPAGHPLAATGETATRAITSARVHTAGKASFLYGRIEVRARLPAGQGLWPAIWMLPEHDNYGPYPQSGEIDVAEAVNLGLDCPGCEDRLHAAVHHGPELRRTTHETGSVPFTERDGFHVFALEWTPERLTWLLDGYVYFSIPAGPPFDQRFHLILNLAVGGTWPETGGRGGVDEGALPAEFLIDWVRIYAPAA
ncbi:MAG TPA: glycoside hydrolase family 16 protein [Brevundimonas sp.]|uniref:glycoside hydrolase family 16 protein n=1 Tax=Brevundimonas sp. TaxID=1871086 RepID=UPI002DEE3899|nr:glycoside hydrolase family 16 protein [Brevundimonas sp.]